MDGQHAAERHTIFGAVDNTSRRRGERGGVTTTDPYHFTGTAPRVPGISREHHASFEAFVDRHRHFMADFVRGQLTAAHRGDAEDALQQGLERLWKEWPDFPKDPGERQRYMKRALRLAALDIVRAREKRSGTPIREIATDYADLDTTQDLGASAVELVKELGRIIARDSIDPASDRDERADRSILIAAFAALDERQRVILGRTAFGEKAGEIGKDLGLRPQHVREQLMRARRVVRSLIEHAAGPTLRADEAKRLWQYRDGKLTGKPKRDIARHVKHCATCQRLLASEQYFDQAAIRVFVPLPLIATLGTMVGAGAAGGGASATTAAGAGASATSAGALGGGSSLAGLGSSVLSGATAKVAVGLAVGAVGLSGAGVTKLYLDRDPGSTKPAAPRLAAVAAAHIPTEPVRHVVTTPSAPARSAAPAKRGPAATKRRKRSARKQPAVEPVAPPMATLASAPGRPAATIPASTSRPSSDSGIGPQRTSGAPDGALETGTATPLGPQSGSAVSSASDLP